MRVPLKFKNSYLSKMNSVSMFSEELARKRKDGVKTKILVIKLKQSWKANDSPCDHMLQTGSVDLPSMKSLTWYR